MKFDLHQHQSAALDMLRASLLAGKKRPMIQDETFAQIAEYDRYWIGDRCTVLSLIRAGRKLVPTISPQGYPYVALMKLGASKAEKQLVHRLVARAFVPNPSGFDVVNHRNGDKQDPRASNLEWVTFSQNNEHARRTGLNTAFGASHYAAKLDPTTVRLIRDRARDGELHREIAADIGVARQTITKVVREKAWRSIR